MSEREGWTPGPWEHQEISDAYTHIIRGAGNRYIGSAPQSLGEADEASGKVGFVLEDGHIKGQEPVEDEGMRQAAAFYASVAVLGLVFLVLLIWIIWTVTS